MLKSILTKLSFLVLVLIPGVACAQSMSELFKEKDRTLRLQFYSDDTNINVEGKVLSAFGCIPNDKKRDFKIDKKKSFGDHPEIVCAKDPKDVHILLTKQNGKAVAKDPEEYRKYIFVCAIEREIDPKRVNIYRYLVNFTDCKQDKPYL